MLDADRVVLFLSLCRPTDQNEVTETKNTTEARAFGAPKQYAKPDLRLISPKVCRAGVLTCTSEEKRRALDGSVQLNDPVRG